SRRADVSGHGIGARSVAMASGQDQRLDGVEGRRVPHLHVMRSTKMASLQCSPQGSLVLWTWVTD
ncbi:hypothetical protein KI387_031226, partial [Taxus chinensis]